jgi:hypothetical protein
VETSNKGNIFSGLVPFVLNIFTRYRSQLQKETNIGLGETPVSIKDSADSTDVKTSNQNIEEFEIDSEDLLEVSENGDDSEYPLKEGEPSRNSRLDLKDENVEGTKLKTTFCCCLFLYVVLVEMLYYLLFIGC